MRTNGIASESGEVVAPRHSTSALSANGFEGCTMRLTPTTPGSLCRWLAACGFPGRRGSAARRPLPHLLMFATSSIRRSRPWPMTRRLRPSHSVGARPRSSRQGRGAVRRHPTVARQPLAVCRQPAPPHRCRLQRGRWRTGADRGGAVSKDQTVDRDRDQPGRHAGFALQPHGPVWSRDRVAGKGLDGMMLGLVACSCRDTARGGETDERCIDVGAPSGHHGWRLTSVSPGAPR
jgi:hypothetical protein